MLQLEHGLVTSDDPTDVLRRPVSQLLAELEPTFAVFFFLKRFSAVGPCGKL